MSKICSLIKENAGDKTNFIRSKFAFFSRSPGRAPSKPREQEMPHIPRVDSASFCDDVFVTCINDRQSPIGSEDKREYEVDKWSGRPYQPVPMHRQFAALASRGFLDTMR